MKKIVVFSLILGLLGSFHHIKFGAEAGRTQAQIRAEIDSLIPRIIEVIDGMKVTEDPLHYQGLKEIPLVKEFVNILNQVKKLRSQLDFTKPTNKDYKPLTVLNLERPENDPATRFIWAAFSGGIPVQEAIPLLDQVREILLTPQRKRETRRAIGESEVGGTAPPELIDLITEFTT